MQKTYKLTRERRKDLEKELLFLKTVREKEVADQIKEARSFGDLSENSEYDEAKNEQGKLYSRIAELEYILANATLIDESSIEPDVVTTGCRVMIEDLDTGDREEYQIVGSQEANPAESRISDESPFGKALIGKRIGQEALVKAPAYTLRYKIVEIQR
jgi:transcription elongation factor GreA